MFVSLGCSNAKALGMANGGIQDLQITASSQNDSFPSHHGRLNQEGTDGGVAAAWRPREDDANIWLQVDFGKMATITAITTQGLGTQWIQSYLLSFVVEGNFEENEKMYVEDEGAKVQTKLLW